MTPACLRQLRTKVEVDWGNSQANLKEMRSHFAEAEEALDIATTRLKIIARIQSCLETLENYMTELEDL